MMINAIYEVTCQFYLHIIKNFFLMSIFETEKERERERERESKQGVAEREGDTESKARSRLRAVNTEPDVGLKIMNCEIMT